MDQKLIPIHRVFFYMPLEHSESAAIQKHSVDLFKRLLDDVDDNLKQVFQGFLEFALAHQKVIDEFGRFPHRNQILGRASSEAEQAYLQVPGAGF